MGKSTTKFYVDGTAALKPRRYSKPSDDGTFVAFRSSSQLANRAARRNQAPIVPENRVKSAIRDTLERSEMACSLLTEDVKGVPYGMLSSENIISISAACTIIAILAIAFGA